MDPKIIELTREHQQYAYEAYEFVCEAVGYTQDRLGRSTADEDDTDADRHVSGGELLRGACELAVREFGMMAPVVFKTWGIRVSDDFGAIVFQLIKVGRLSKSDRDDPDDFHDVLDIDKVLSEGFELVVDDAAPRRGGR